MNYNAINESELFLVATWDLPLGLGQARWLLWAMVALSQHWLDVCLLSEQCLRDVLQNCMSSRNVASRASGGWVLHGNQCASCLQTMAFSGLFKVSFVSPKQHTRVRLQKVVKGCAW